MLGFMPVSAWWARQGLNLRPHPCEGSYIMKNGGIASPVERTDRDSSGNITASADHNLTTHQNPGTNLNPLLGAIESSVAILREAIDQFAPTHIVSMVSGGKDSAACDQIARELGVAIDFVMHGNTRCGIPETSEFVRETYGALGEYVEADAGSAYEDYVIRKGFFGKGIGAHGFAYRILKAQPFRKAISREIRQGMGYQ